MLNAFMINSKTFTTFVTYLGTFTIFVGLFEKRFLQQFYMQK